MARSMLGWLVVAHGLLTILIWVPDPRKLEAPMDTSHSWLLGDARTLSVVLATVAGLFVAVSGVGLVTDAA